MSNFLRGAAVIDTLLTPPQVETGTEPARARPSVTSRLAARLTPGRYDRQLAGGAPVSGNALAVHANRITARSQRDSLIDTLHKFQGIAAAPPSVPSARVLLDRTQIAAAAALIGDIVDRLADSRPVCARGIAMLRILLSDGSGPMYRTGRGCLNEELCIIIAAL